MQKRLANAFAEASRRPKCPDCGNRGYREGRYCACAAGLGAMRRDERERAQFIEEQRALHQERLRSAVVFPGAMGRWTLDTHPMRGTDIWQDIHTFLAAWDWERGLVLQGDYGVGKTGLLVGALKVLLPRAVSEGWSMRFITSLDLILRLQAGFKDDSYTDTIEEYAGVHLLALDDLGAEMMTEWRQDQYLAILNARYNRRLPLFATTNCDHNALMKRLTPRVYWRLFETCTFVDVQGDNLRA